MSALFQLCQALYDTPFATGIRESEVVFPAIETVHVLGLAAMAGTIAIVDLRLLGVLYRDVPADVVEAQVLPITWIGFGLLVVTGGLLFTAEAAKVFYNPALRVKFVLLILAGLNMALFNVTVRRRIAAWRAEPRAPLGGRAAAAGSLALWAGVIFAGRAIAYFH
ncbi:MAG: DUF6644 family protein [Phenylobacterium sp.]